MNRGIALEVGAGCPLPEVEKRLGGAPREAGVSGQRNRDVDVEDLLREPLVGIDRRVEEHQRERRRHEDDGRDRKRGKRELTKPGGHETAGMIAEAGPLAATLAAWLIS